MSVTVLHRDPSQDYWDAVTNVPCPECDGGLLCWHEAGYAPGHRRCDMCGGHWIAKGNAQAPRLERAVLVDNLILGWDQSKELGYEPDEDSLFGG